MRLRLPLGALLATALVVPTTVVLPTVTLGGHAPHPVAPHLSTVALTGVDPLALRTEPVPRALVERSAARRAVPAPAVLTARLATSDYSLVGVTWLPNRRPVELVVSVRTRSDGRWSHWQELHQLADAASGPELASSTRLGTAPQWVGPSDGVQARVDVQSGVLPKGLRVDLVDPGTSPADADLADQAPPATAAAAGTMPDIVTRAEWGADESLRDRTLVMSRTIKAAFVHHTAGSNSYSRAQAPAVVRGLLAYSTQSMGYADIPYNFLVDKYGRIYEGRAGSITTPVKQAATGGFNPDTMSVVAMGNFVSHAAPDAMVHSIAEILAFRLSSYHLDPYGTTTLVSDSGDLSRYATGQRATFDVISGHRDAGYTACPGDRLYRRLPEIRRQVADLMGASFVRPRVSTTSVAYGAPDAVRLRSGALTSMHWRLTVTEACDGTVVSTTTGRAGPDAPVDVTWRGRDDAGRPVPAGRYVVSLTGGSPSSRAVPWRTTVALQVGSPGALPTRSKLAAAPAGRYVAVTPTRLASTATGFGTGARLTLGPDSRVQVPVLGRAGVPAADVTGVAVSVLAACPSRATTVAVGPSQVPVGQAAAVSVDANRTARGLAVTGLGPDGALTVHNAVGAVTVSLSVVGYWTTAGPGDGFVALTPTPVPGSARGLSVGPSPVDVVVAGASGVPSGASAVVLNVRRYAAGDAGSVWVWPAGTQRPAEAALRRDPGQPAEQRLVVPLGSGGAVSVAADQAGAVRLDVVGYLGTTGSRFHPVAPRRVTASDLRLAASGSARVTVGGVAGVPSSARAVVLQLAGSGAQDLTRLTVFPAGRAEPSSPDLSVPRHRDRTNLVVVPLGNHGRVRVANSGSAVGVTLTVVGWLG